MKISMSGDGDGLDIRIRLRWVPLIALIAAIVALLSSPAVVRVWSWLGW